MSHLLHTLGSLLPARQVRGGPAHSRNASHRRILLALLTLTLTYTPLAADSFSDGVAAYEKGEYEPALEYFNASIAGGETAAARHNLALTHFQLEQPAEAAWQIERALRLDPMNAEYRYKLGALREQLGLPENKPQWFKLGAQALSPTTWVLVATVSFWLLLAALLLPRLNRTRTGIGTKALRIATALALVIAIPAIWLHAKALQAGIVISNVPASLHAAPASAAPESGSARPGERARIRDRHNAFYRIETESGITGWISNENFKPLSLSPPASS